MSTPISYAVAVLAVLLQLPIPSPQVMVWVDRQGKLLGTIGQPQWSIAYTTLSPDDTKVAVKAVDAENGNPYIFVVDVARGTRIRLTANAANEGQPAWSPTGDRIAFISYRNGLSDLFLKSIASGQPEVQITTNQQLHDFAPSWSPDGKFIVFHTQDPKSNQRDLMYMSVDDWKPIPFVQTPSAEASGTFSPDGKFVAYVSNETGKYEVYVKQFPPTETRWTVSTNGGIWPKWSRNGDELFFFQGNDLMSASTQMRPAFKSGMPQKLFSGQQVGMGPRPMDGLNPSYEPARDAQKFIVVQTAR
jgi:Tol biopolymer transport system component